MSMCVSELVCLCVCMCLSVMTSSELHVLSSPNFLCLLPMAMAQPSSGSIVIRYVFLSLWMTLKLVVAAGLSQ